MRHSSSLRAETRYGCSAGHHGPSQELQALIAAARRRTAVHARLKSTNIEHTSAQLMEPLGEQAGLGSVNGEVRSFVAD